MQEVSAVGIPNTISWSKPTSHLEGFDDFQNGANTRLLKLAMQLDRRDAVKKNVVSRNIRANSWRHGAPAQFHTQHLISIGIKQIGAYAGKQCGA